MKTNPTHRHFILQKDAADCGIACLQNLLFFYGGYMPAEQLREISGTDAHGTNMLGLSQGAREAGFRAGGVEAGSVDDLKTLTAPCILYIVQDNRQHYMVLYRWDGKHFIVGDPAKGILSLSAEQLSAIWKKKALLLMEPTEKIKTMSGKYRSRGKWLYQMIGRYLNFLLMAAGLGIIASALSLSTAIFSQKLVDKLLGQADSKKLFISVAMLSIILIFRAFIFYLRGWILARQSKEFNKELTGSFYQKILHLPKSFFDHRKTGDMVARLNDANRIQQTVSLLVGDVSIQALLLLTATITLFVYSAMAGLIGLIFIPLVFFIVKRIQSALILGQKDSMIANAQNESNYIDNIRGIGIIKLFDRETLFLNRATRLIGNLQDANFRIGKIKIRFNLTIDILANIFFTALIVCGITQVLHKHLLAGEMIAVLQLGVMLMQTATAVAMTNIQIQEARVAFDRMYELVSLEVDAPVESVPVGGAGAVSGPDAIDAFEWLSIGNLDFRFPGRATLLKQVSLQVEKGEIVAIVGESGQGKSTIFQLLQKFYSWEKGTILVNGLPLETIDQSKWRKLIGVVTQEAALFSGTVMENILLDNYTAEAGEAVTAFCTQTGLITYLSRLPQGLHTLIGEGGVNISGGQKQLVCLARCLFHQPQLLLLDEPTAAMDKSTEAFVIALLQEWRSKAGMIIISHKDSLTNIADTVYELENGKLLSLHTSTIKS
jgi:ABC-type bacteriocin/lantibiotic exporter with double-glycine peptidase domain